MAKRRKLETPSAEDLNKIEEEFRRETAPRSGLSASSVTAPIAQVAADVAAQAPVLPPEVRAEQAKQKVDAERLQDAESRGLLMADLPVIKIQEDVMVRDRAWMKEDDLTELRQSIAAGGLRLPIEVFELEHWFERGPRYGLISGYRRLTAVRDLLQETGDDDYRNIRAIIRPRSETHVAFAAMVEENEIRSELSHFERGRIAVIATQQGAFGTTEDAVNHLFGLASKAKRSKVRSFALIFEELGDMLTYPEALTERRGLKLAQALRQGSAEHLRGALERSGPNNGEAEWQVLEAEIDALGAPAPDPRKGGRPKSASAVKGWKNVDTVRTGSGVTIQRKRDGDGVVFRLSGEGLDDARIDRLMDTLRLLLETHDGG